jgi:hypothetical protein
MLLLVPPGSAHAFSGGGAYHNECNLTVSSIVSIHSNDGNILIPFPYSLTKEQISTSSRIKLERKRRKIIETTAAICPPQPALSIYSQFFAISFSNTCYLPQFASSVYPIRGPPCYI